MSKEHLKCPYCQTEIFIGQFVGGFRATREPNGLVSLEVAQYNNPISFMCSKCNAEFGNVGEIMGATK